MAIIKSANCPPPGWNLENGIWTYMHLVSEYYDSDPIKDADCFRRHLLLEVLDYLGVLEYSRGYDGIYYDIDIRQRKRS